MDNERFYTDNLLICNVYVEYNIKTTCRDSNYDYKIEVYLGLS